MGRRFRAAVTNGRIDIVADRVAHARKPTAAGANQCREHRLDPVAQREIGIADDALRHLDWAVTAACAHRGDAGDEPWGWVRSYCAYNRNDTVAFLSSEPVLTGIAGITQGSATPFEEDPTVTHPRTAAIALALTAL